MKKVFLILGALIVVSGLMSGFQYNERKAELANRPPESEIVETAPQDPASSSSAAEEVWDGKC